MSTATMAAPPAPSTTAPAGPHAAGGLAVALEEAFTVATRLRGQRQAASDAASFRQHVKQLLTLADDQARRAGYGPEHARLAIFAYIAFLDESVLNSGLPIFAEWPRQPLQEEIFGEHMAGETFFRIMQELLARQDSPALADLLEVFLLCLLLGFKGKYSAGGEAAIQGLVAAAQEKILRIRGGRGEFSPYWRPPTEVIATARDPWVRRLGILAGATALLALLLFLAYKISLHGGIKQMLALVSRLAG